MEYALPFEQAENIKFTLEQQMVFFARLVGNFKVADDITPIKIENIDWSLEESVAVAYISWNMTSYSLHLFELSMYSD